MRLATQWLTVSKRNLAVYWLIMMSNYCPNLVAIERKNKHYVISVFGILGDTDLQGRTGTRWPQIPTNIWLIQLNTCGIPNRPKYNCSISNLIDLKSYRFTCSNTDHVFKKRDSLRDWVLSPGDTKLSKKSMILRPWPVELLVNQSSYLISI